MNVSCFKINPEQFIKTDLNDLNKIKKGDLFVAMKSFSIVNLFLIILLFISCGCNGQKSFANNSLLTGADQTEQYLSLLKGKSIAIVANPTSRIGNTHLVDSLKNSGINIKVIFAPEHGFRGDKEAGEDVVGGIDKKSGIKVVSLFGNHNKPSAEDLKNIQLVVFDIQDVGVRFYTYISTLQYVMEACAENNIPLIIFDRPNPHGYYIDGPVLNRKFKSFVGMQPIPVVHGMTIAEYASMLNGEKWLEGNKACELIIIKMKGWNHHSIYNLPVRPSPNLPNMTSVYLYPSLCFFEGTIVSVGRGTDLPFQVIGYPDKPTGSIKFTPTSIPGVAKNPPYEGRECNGFNLQEFGNDVAKSGGRIFINWLIQSYHESADTTNFFNNFFDKLAGTDKLREQIRAGWTEEQIRNSWGDDLEQFRMIRKKYLLYPE